MSTATIRQLLEIALAAITDTTIDTANENTNYVPTDGKPYQQINLMFGKPDNPTVTPGFHREKGVFQVTLQYPFSSGAGAAQARADILLAAFARGVSFSSGQITVTMSPSPYATPGRVDGNRWAIVVKIPFFANVFE